MWLLVGLGNPGPKYAQNRHNIGFMVIDEIASRSRSEAWRSKFGGELASGDVAGAKAVLLKPQEYMNVSGQSVQRTAAFYQVEPKQVIVAHDEIDLPLGTKRVKVGGGHGGHNGLRSIIQELGSQEFLRVRVGVGRPGPAGKGSNVAGFVLEDFAKSERTEVEIVIKEAADALEDIIKKGALAAMNKWNGSSSAGSTK
jgi:peptidyl-tRNA hydrolase, PTH1 family